MADLNKAYDRFVIDHDYTVLLMAVHTFALSKARQYRIADPEDAAQDVVIRTRELISHYDPARGNFRGWVATLAANYLRTCHRSAKRWRGTFDGDVDADAIMPAQHDDIPTRNPARLPEPMQQIAALLVLGYDKDEIAARIGCSVRTIERRIEEHLAQAA